MNNCLPHALNRLIAVVLTGLLLVAACKPPSPNLNPRLAKAASPYLRQHATNPVNWYPWGPEALAVARQQNKPLLISIGYAACHWCHQMEQESFMDTAVARLMNENFVCIKVDREERPDLDKIYVQACQLLNKGQAGWPLHAFALPDGKPFFAGTYYTKEAWVNLLNKVTDSYKNKHSKVMLQAAALSFGMQDADSLLLLPNSASLPVKHSYMQGFASALKNIDSTYGGITGNQKFPTPGLWEFLLQYHYYTKDTLALNLANTTLLQMAGNALYDHFGYGFFRYTTDSKWQQPHYEKMLYDNAQLISLYANAYKLTQNEWYKWVATQTIHFVEKELSADKGGFYASLSAQTQQGEGATYLLTQQEVTNASKRIADINGLFQFIAINTHGKVVYLPALNSKALQMAARGSVQQQSLVKALIKFSDAIKVWRQDKPLPAVDDKILLAWNALMLKAYADAYVAFGHEPYLTKAETLASFLEKHFVLANGTVHRMLVPEATLSTGFLEDYACLIKAYLRLYEVSFNQHWLTLAQSIFERAQATLFDAASGMFMYALQDTSMATPFKKLNLLDNVMPAANALMAENAFYLGNLLNKPSFTTLAQRMLERTSDKLVQFTTSSPHWALVSTLLHNEHLQVAIVGPQAAAINKALQKHFLPNCTWLGGNEEYLPLLEGKLKPNQTWIYVCTNQNCKKPVTTIAEALEQIKLVP